MTIEEYWKKIGSPQYIYNDYEIELFLSKWIYYTEGNTNIDSISDSGFADSLVKIEKCSSYYLLYWKDYKELIDKKDRSRSEDEYLQIFSNFTYIYHLIDIRKIEVIDTGYNGIALIIYSNYINEKKVLKSLEYKFKFRESKTHSRNGSIKREIVFLDNKSYKHSCELNLLPLSNLLLLQKNKPWRTNTSKKVLVHYSLYDLMLPIEEIKKELSLIKDEDEFRIREVITNIRYTVEGLLKFYYVLLTIENENDLSDDIDYPKVFKKLMSSYGSLTIGYLKKDLKIDNAKVVPENFVLSLNKYSHYTGRYPDKKILLELIIQYDNLVDSLFDFDNMKPKK